MPQYSTWKFTPSINYLYSDFSLGKVTVRLCPYARLWIFVPFNVFIATISVVIWFFVVRYALYTTPNSPASGDNAFSYYT